ncbi:MAG: LptA/OstA family protein [Pseudomonadota bacterium]
MAINKNNHTKFASLGVVLAIAIGFAGIATAQNLTGGAVQVSANEIDLQPLTNTAVFSGNAEVIQAGNVLRSARFRVQYTADGAIERIVTDSEIFFTSPSERVRANRGEFNAAANTISFFGNVVLSQGQNVVTGEELRINTVTRATFMKSGQGRVKGVFFPSSTPK